MPRKVASRELEVPAEYKIPTANSESAGVC